MDITKELFIKFADIEKLTEHPEEVNELVKKCLDISKHFQEAYDNIIDENLMDFAKKPRGMDYDVINNFLNLPITKERNLNNKKVEF